MNTVAQALPNSTIWGFLLFCQAIWKKMLAILSTEYVILHHEVLLEKESHLSAFTLKICVWTLPLQLIIMRNIQFTNYFPEK